MIGQELNPGLLGEKPANSHQSCGKTWILTSRQKIYWHCQEANHDSSMVQPVT